MHDFAQEIRHLLAAKRYDVLEMTATTATEEAATTPEWVVRFAPPVAYLGMPVGGWGPLPAAIIRAFAEALPENLASGEPDPGPDPQAAALSCASSSGRPTALRGGIDQMARVGQRIWQLSCQGGVALACLRARTRLWLADGPQTGEQSADLGHG